MVPVDHLLTFAAAAFVLIVIPSQSVLFEMRSQAPPRIGTTTSRSWVLSSSARRTQAPCWPAARSLPDRLFMAALSRVLPRPRWSSFLVSPQTLLRWHRELVRRSGPILTGPPAGGHRSQTMWRSHPADGEGEPAVGCVRIKGELAKLGVRVSASAIRTLLRRDGFAT
jgi:hypothetical protein